MKYSRFAVFLVAILLFGSNSLDATVSNWDKCASSPGYPFVSQITVDGADQFTLKPYNLHLSLTGTDSGQLRVYNVQGDEVTTGLSFFGYDPTLISVSATGVVTALRTENPTEIGTWVQVSVDGINAGNTSVVRVLSADVNAQFKEFEGKRTVLYSPTTIDDENIEQYVKQYQIPLVNDYAYTDQLNLLGTKPFGGARQIFEVDFGESETNRVCGISGNPLRLGWNLNGSDWSNCFLVPFTPPRSPQWFIFYHEAAHNTTWASFTFGQGIGRFEYSEGVATYTALTNFQRFADEPDFFVMGSAASSTIADINADNRLAYSSHYSAWLGDGAPFEALDPDIVDGILLYHEANSAACFAERFLNIFQPRHQPQLQAILDEIDTPEEQHTLFAAAVSAASETNLISTFSDTYHYPIQTELFNEAYPALSGIAPPDSMDLNAPLNEQTVTGSVTLDWDNVPGAVGYNVYVGTGNPPRLYKSKVVDSELQIDGLAAKTHYYWLIEALFRCDTPLLSEVRSFTTDFDNQLANDPDTRLLLHFNGDLQGADGELPAANNGLSFEPGVVGESINVPSPDGLLVYNQEENISVAEGTVEFWFKPTWNGSQDSITRLFFNAGLPFNQGMLLSIDGANNLRFIQWGDDPLTPTIETNVERGLAVSGADLQADRWYHLAATWKAGEHMALYRDGRVVASRPDAVVIDDFWGNALHIGSDTGGALQADSVFDELRISARQRSDLEIWEDYSLALADEPRPDLIFSDGFEKYDYWPNPISKSNSDPWLVKHHDEIRVMRPRVLVLNFMNDFTHDGVMTEQLIEALRQSTTYHGYSSPAAAPFLEYEVARYVDLRDPPGTETLDGNSTLYPRVPDWNGGNNFAYEQLYTEEFAAHFGFEDPSNPGTFLDLAQLLDQGIINEVWFFAYHGAYGAPYETIEIKQYYDHELNPIPGLYGGAGNGHYPGLPWTGRSLRFTFINGQRGIGCAMENLGHALEGMAHFNFSPYWRSHFYEFAGFDLDERWGLPFESFYGGVTNNYPQPDRLEWSRNDQSGTVENYFSVGGNVHFMPAGRYDYDLLNTQSVYSTIEHYRLFDGPGGADMMDLWDRSKFTAYEPLAPDCMGPWLVYWRMNMPGFGNEATDQNGLPMKNWWVFLFY